MIARRSFLIGAFSSVWAVGASAYAAEENAVTGKKGRIPFVPSADDADDRAFTKEVEKAAPKTDPVLRVLVHCSFIVRPQGRVSPLAIDLMGRSTGAQSRSCHGFGAM